MNLKPINIEEFKNHSRHIYRGFSIHVTTGTVTISRLMAQEIFLKEGDHLLFANDGTEWYLTVGQSGGFRLKLKTDTKNKKRESDVLKCYLGRMFSQKLIRDLHIPPRGRIMLSENRIPNNGLMWYKLTAVQRPKN